ncbi:DUF5302 domain-containing protein [Nocardia uniformis]|uniref:DUF5302 domain-containing protein n=1 Tax=Nocardia uniformis TaxID=53432 RepID=A0A849BVT8_9NOCA|nr:DUF5302 domain-containing protein [Nocardia uniformis]NNH69218.1 DUF5302 domain-containing protein [Nocardia uniformis]
MKSGDQDDTEATAASEPAETGKPADDIKRRFREALERKQGRHSDGVGTGGGGNSKVHGTHGPANNKQMFRRKSGG